MVAPPTRFGTMVTKAELRSMLRQRRNRFRADASTAFPWHGEMAPALKSVMCVGSYCAMGSEPDLDAVTRRIAETGVMTAMPRVDGRETVMTFHQWVPGDQLERAAFGFVQPLANSPIVAPDLLLVPLLGFDRAMRRIGQGAGHYDRYFARYPGAIRIGTAWSVQEVDAVITDHWDMPMDAICTEKEWISSAQGRNIT